MSPSRCARIPPLTGETLMPARSSYRFPCRTALGLAVLMLVGPGVFPLAAQQNQPIYPAYDGFTKNPDGSYTIAFAYFSHNAEAVTIPAGAGNVFAPTPGDRQQPTVFKP